MILQIAITKIKSFFTSGNNRSLQAKKSIALLVVFHAFNLLITMALVPLSISILGKVHYGVWVTVSSVIFWLNYLDFGIGNGLRNKVAEALAKEDQSTARSYVSTAYIVFLIAACGVIITSVIGNMFINWAAILNAPAPVQAELKMLMFYAFALFAVQIFLKLINSLINADQQPALNGFISLLINTASFCGLYIMQLQHNNSLLQFGIISFGLPVLVLVTVSIYLFKTKYKQLAPSLRYVNFSYTKSLAGIGLQFFIMQIASLVVFSTQNLIISRLLGPAEVTVYNVAFRYFSILTLIFGVILTPFWSAFTDAYVKQDYGWIHGVMRKILIIWCLFSFLAIVMIIASATVYKFWVGDSIQVPMLLSVSIGLFTIISNWNNVFAYFFNGVGKIRLEFYTAIFIMVVNIPLSIWLVGFPSIGMSGIVISNGILLLIASIWSPIQYYKIISNTATGIWNK